MPEPAGSPRPFKIQVAEDVLADLRQRLARVRWPDEIPGAGWRYGTDLGYMKEPLRDGNGKLPWRRLSGPAFLE